MASERFKELTINDFTFKIGRIPALRADWIARLLNAGTAGSEENFDKVQGYCLEVCQIYQPMPNGADPILKPVFGGGRILAPELQFDLDTINRLGDAVISFNFDDFFEKKKAEREAAKAKALFEQQASTTTP